MGDSNNPGTPTWGDDLGITRGIRNSTGILCYRNAALILLAHTVDLVHHADNHPYHSQGCLLCPFHDFSGFYWYGLDAQVNPAAERFWDVIRPRWRDDPAEYKEQQDSLEFLFWLCGEFCIRE